ncbi:MAG: AMP-binding protein [Crocinitomix sp.]|nr:AMP-binding protein [Crocinitomix sp.]
MIEPQIHPVFEDLNNTFKSFPNRVALIDKDNTPYTYSAFQLKIAGAYHELTKKGLKKGDKLLIAVPMSVDLYAILEAVFALGATAVFLDPWMKGRKMSSAIRLVKPDLFIVTRKLSRITWLLPATWFLKKWKVDTVPSSNLGYSIAVVKDEDDALITFTSGTSGKPKGANRSFSFLQAQASILKKHLGERAEASVDFTNFPIVGLANFALGNTVVIPRINLMKIHTADELDILDQLTKNKVNRLIVSPALLKKILRKLPKNTSINEVMSGGAPIPMSTIQQAITNFPNIKFEGIYGATEAEPICISGFNEIAAHFDEPLKGVYVGKKIDGIELKIIQHSTEPIDAETFKNSELANGEIGEVVVSGAHVNASYFQNQTAFLQHKIMDDAGKIWHRTGDMGYFDGENLFLVGREHRIMEFEGKKLYPYPIEQFIQRTFELDDVGYLQNSNGKFSFFAYSTNKSDKKAIKKCLRTNGFPIDEVNLWNMPLPRDARHKSKLQIEDIAE